MDEQSTRVVIGEILDPVPQELREELARSEWQLTDDVQGQAVRYGGMGPDRGGRPGSPR
jgi:hypothetical protein